MILPWQMLLPLLCLQYSKGKKFPFLPTVYALIICILLILEMKVIHLDRNGRKLNDANRQIAWKEQ